MDLVQWTVQRTHLFDELDAQGVAVVLDAVEKREFEAGDIILGQGDYADAMYIVFEGAVQIFVTTEDGSPLVLAKRGPGTFFGEQALLPGGTGQRNASARAHTRSVVLRIDRATFQKALAHEHPLKQRLVQLGEEQLQQRLALRSRLFRSLNIGDVDAVEETFDAGEIIFREGESADCLYVIVSGVAVVYHEKAGQQVLVSRVGAGRSVGELALLRQSLRSATVIAETPVRARVVSADRFRELLDRSPDLRGEMQSLQRLYELPGRGFITQHTGRFLDRESITTVYHLTDGRGFIASRVSSEDIFNLECTGPARTDADRTLRFEDAVHGLVREIRLAADGLVLGATVYGPWIDLPQLHLHALEGRPLSPEQCEAFAHTGMIVRAMALPEADEAQLVCTCINVSRGTLHHHILAGCDQLEELQVRTSCGTVCGGCIPSVLEMLGKSTWMPVFVDEGVPIAKDIRTFRLKPRDGRVVPALPGQHIVVQAYISGTWVERPYTLSAFSVSQEHYEITLKREPLGTFSRWLFDQHQVDSLIRVSNPCGDFYWRRTGVPLLCFVGGIGVTPALAVVRTVVHEQLSDIVHVHYSAHTAAEFVALAELRDAGRAFPNVHLTFRETSREGRLTQADVDVLVHEYPTAEYILCGPQGYLHAVAGFLAAAGVPKGRVQIEVFNHVGDPPQRQPPVPGSATGASGVAVVTSLPSSQAVQAPHIGDAGGLFQTPVVVRPSAITRVLCWIGALLWKLARLRFADWRVFGLQLNPLHALFDWIATRMARADPAVPQDALGCVGTLALGSSRHQTEEFRRLSERFAVNKVKARQAREHGESLPSNTPDGDTWAYTIPNVPLEKFEGPLAVQTGWDKAATRAFLPVYVIRGRTALHTILLDGAQVDRGPLPYHYIQQILGSSKIVPDAGRKPAGLFAGQLHQNRTWQIDRDIGVKAFGPAMLERHAVSIAAILDEIIAEVDTLVRTNPEHVIDGGFFTRRVAFRIVMRSTFGNLHLDELLRLGEELQEPTDKALQFAYDRTVGKGGDVATFQRIVGESKRVIADMAEIIRNAARLGHLDATQLANPLIELIVHGDENGPRDAESLFPLIFAIIIGGHETTGHMLAWALYETARNPALKARVIGEIDACYRTNGGRVIALERIDERPVMQAFLYEIGRRHPAITVVPRMALEPGEIPPDPDTGIGGFQFPRDAFFLCSILGAHMDPETYPDPQSFRIERFFEGVAPELSRADQGRRVRANARRLEEECRLLTFGGGAGTCLGRAFNMLECFIVLDGLLRRFSFELVDPAREIPDSEPPLSGPVPGMLALRVSRRTPTANDSIDTREDKH